MPMVSATRRASSASARVQQPLPWTCSAAGVLASLRWTPVTSQPSAASSAAVTEESTPPLIATSTLRLAMAHPGGQLGHGSRGGGAEAGQGGHRQGARAQAALLAAAVGERAQPGARPYDQGADASRAAELVGAEREQVDRAGCHVDAWQAGGLD